MSELTRQNAEVPVIPMDAFLSREMDGDLLLYDRESDAVHTLNGTAGFIYACCNGISSVQEIVDRVAECFGTDSDSVRDEVEATLLRLQSLGSVPVNLPTCAPGSPRREFLTTALKGAAMLPFVAPTVETLFLQDAGAQSVPPPPTDPPPVVTSCTPNNGGQGDSFEVLVKGSDFTATPTASFGAGISINYVTYQNQGRIKVGITISAFATPGLRDVTITNPDTQSDTLINGFTVNTPPVGITVISCTPNNGNKNQTLNVTVAGTGFTATPTASFGAKIDVNSVTYISSTTLTVNISIRHNAKSGSRDVTITNPGGANDTLAGGFSVN